MQLGERARARLLWGGRAVFAVVLVGVLVKAAVDNLDQLRDVRFQPQPGWLLLAAPFTFAGGLALPLAWRHVLYAYGQHLDRSTAVRVWCVSQSSRFVPGNVALVASRVLLSNRVGVPKSLAGASLAVELGLILVWGAFYTSWLPSYWLPGPVRALIGSAAVGVLLAFPWLVRLVGRLLPRFPAIAPGALRVRHLYEAVGLYGLNDFVRCCGFVLVTASLHTIDASDLFRVTAVVNAGMIVGMIGITPAGLGVREGVVAALLEPRFGLGTAAAMAVAYRVWDFGFELVWLSIALAWERRTKRLRGADPLDVLASEP
jgi:glycosyltransferase 2 family protein